MIYHCDTEIIDISNSSMRLLKNPYCATTVEGMSYEKDGYVYKIYHNNEESYFENVGILDEKSCDKLTSIKELKHIYLPTELIYDEANKYAGCKSVFIKPLGEDEQKIIDKPVFVFWEEMYQIIDDLDVLTENNVLVGDFGIHNMIDNGHINIFDAGAYIVDFNNEYSKRQISNNQLNELNILLSEIIEEQLFDMIDNDNPDWIKCSEYIQKLAKYTTFFKMLEKETRSYNSISEFAKDLCKTKIKKL